MLFCLIRLSVLLSLSELKEKLGNLIRNNPDKSEHSKLLEPEGGGGTLVGRHGTVSSKVLITIAWASF